MLPPELDEHRPVRLDQAPRPVAAAVRQPLPMDDARGGLVEGAQAAGADPVGEVRVLVIGRRVALVEAAEAAPQVGGDHHRGGGHVVDVAKHGVARVGCIGVATDIVDRAVMAQRRAGFLEGAVGEQEHRPGKAVVGMRLERRDQGVEPAGQHPGVVVEQHEVAAARRAGGAVAVARKAEVARRRGHMQARHGAEHGRRLVARCIVGDDDLERRFVARRSHRGEAAHRDREIAELFTLNATDDVWVPSRSDEAVNNCASDNAPELRSYVEAHGEERAAALLSGIWLFFGATGRVGGMTLVPVIMSGGAGSRLWPLSREAHPKPFIELPEGGTLIGKTYARAAALDGVSHILTVTNRDFLFLTVDAYALAGAAGQANSFLLEPMGRDTAAAVALASVYADKTIGREAVLLILPADHLITDEAAFARAVNRAVALAGQDHIVTFGVVPERPETGFGYIEAEGETVLRFVEKPDAKTAARYLTSGSHYWNSGMFCFKSGVMLTAMEIHCPGILEGACTAFDQAQQGRNGGHATIEIAREPFEKIPSLSIDYAVMEKADNIACVPVSCGWSDIGSWAAISELLSADEAGNRVTGETMLEGARGCFVHSKDRLVGLVGVSDLLVVDTPDALLVAHKDRAQDVKHLYNRLYAHGHEAAKLHRTAHRPWGTYTVLGEGDRFKIKRIEVKPGQRLSLQAHHHRSEHWVVVSGSAKVVNGDREILLSTNQSTYIPCGHKHRLENPGILPLVLIEVQSGEYLGEDDIVRFDDVYGRA